MISQLLYLDGKWVRGRNLLRAHALYSDHFVDLQTNVSTKSDLRSTLTDWLGQPFVQKDKSAKIIHLFYELGLVTHGISVNEDVLLGIYFEFEAMEPFEDSTRTPKLHELSRVSFEIYEEAFKRGYEHLLRGDCYQFNLTYPFTYAPTHKLDASAFASAIKGPGEFAHAADVGPLGISLLSNSPESLYEREGEDTIVTKPIKGTIRKAEGAASKLLASRKDRAELDMITDLLRNDLNRIEIPRAEVRARSKLMEITHLYHLYSEVSLKLSKETSLKEVTLSLFPSGSVTGAPKKRVMNILTELEMGERGLYCGSTIFSFGDILRANVNIRSGIVDHSKNLFTYHAGGGCTLLSSAPEEYREMLDKVESFTMSFSH